MTKFNVGDLVVLKSGSMRMCVEAASDELVSVVWCNEGVIGRDAFMPQLLNVWEHREDGYRPRPAPAHDGDAPRPYRPAADRDGPKTYRGAGEGKPPRRRPAEGEGDAPRPRRAPAGAAGERAGGAPPRKTGWDGKPREKKFFRKDE